MSIYQVIFDRAWKLIIRSLENGNSNIQVIILYGNHLSGHLRSSIYLPNLETLFLWQNNLCGIVPDSICNASEVTILELSKNLCSCLIPNTSGNCRQLQILSSITWLLDLQLKDRVPTFYSSLTNCSYVRVLAIDTNPLKRYFSQFYRKSLYISWELLCKIKYCSCSWCSQPISLQSRQRVLDNGEVDSLISQRNFQDIFMF